MLTVNQTPLNPQQIIRLQPGQELAATEAAKRNGNDELFFRAGNDIYVASGRHLPVKGLTPGAAVQFDNQPGTVLAVDNQVNSAKEGAIKVLKPSSWAVGGATAAAAVVFGIIGAKVAGSIADTLPGTFLTAGAAAGVAGLAVAAGAIYGTTRKSDDGLLASFGTAVNAH